MSNSEKLLKKKKNTGEVLADLSLPILLVVLVVFFSIMSKSFFTSYNLTNILLQNVHLVIIACAVMIIMVSGGCDLSIGYQMFAAAFSTELLNMDTFRRQAQYSYTTRRLTSILQQRQ